MCSSTSRSCRRDRASPGAWLRSPAPAGVPVERMVRIGFVGPLTERPLSGVWARSRSRPVPPSRGRRLLAALFRLFADPLADFAAVFLDFAEAFLDFAAVFLDVGAAFLVLDAARRAVLRLAAFAVLRPVLRLAAALRLVPAFFRVGVRFRPDFFAVFFAMCRLSRPSESRPPAPRARQAVID